MLQQNHLQRALVDCGNSIYNSSHNMGSISPTVEYVKQNHIKGAATPRVVLVINMETLHLLSDQAQSFIRPVLESTLRNSREAIAQAAHTGNSLYLSNTVEVLNSTMYELVNRYMHLFQYKTDLLYGLKPTFNINTQLQMMEFSRNIPDVDYNLHRIIGRVLTEYYAARHHIHFTPVPLVLESNVFDTINCIVQRYNLQATWEVVFKQEYLNTSLDHVEAVKSHLLKNPHLYFSTLEELPRKFFKLSRKFNNI